MDSDPTLGFTMRFDRSRFAGSPRYLNVFPSTKSLAYARSQLHELTIRRRGWLPPPALVSQVSTWLHSWGRYFDHGYPAKAFAAGKRGGEGRGGGGATRH